MSDTKPAPVPDLIDADEEQDEALVVSLFGLRPNSPQFNQTVNGINVVDGNSTPMNTMSLGGSVVSSHNNLDDKLKHIEDKFLAEKNVNSNGVLLSSLADRFTKSRVPNATSSVDDYVDEFLDNAVYDAVHTSSPNMIGHMTSSLPYFVRPLSRLIATMNQNCVKTETASTMTFLEREAMAQLHREIYNFDDKFYDKYAQDPGTVLGVFTSGGTLANVTAVWAARNSTLAPNDALNCRGIEIGGLWHAMQSYGYKGLAIIGSSLLHYSLAKTVDVLGLGLESLISIPVESDFTVSPKRVEDEVIRCEKNGIRVIAIVGVAGATETGSVDPLNELADVAARHNIHFHVDAAWGGPLIFSKKHKHKLAGIERANSVTLDGHKQLYMPMGCGLLFFRNPELSNAVRKSANYIIRKESYDLGKFTLEGSRPANAIYLHSNLNILGVRGYELLVNRSCRMTNYMAKCIRESDDFELVVEPTSNILLYRAIPPSLVGKTYPDDLKDRTNVIAEDITFANSYNITLQSMQKLRGKTFVSRTTIQSPLPQHFGKHVVALRVVIANPLTYERDIDRVLEDQRSILKVITRVTGDGTVAASSSVDLEAEVRSVLELDDNIHEEQPAHDAPPKVEYSEYWKAFFDNSPEVVKSLFKNNREQFLDTLVAPSNSADSEQGGILRDDRYTRLMQRANSI